MAPPICGSVPPPNSSDEQKTGATASFHHVFHVEQMAGIGAQVVLYALFVPDVDEDATENAGA